MLQGTIIKSYGCLNLHIPFNKAVVFEMVSDTKVKSLFNISTDVTLSWNSHFEYNCDNNEHLPLSYH